MKILFLLLFTVFSANAATEKDCDTIGDYLKMEDCYHSNSKLAEEELNTSYNKIIKKLNERPNAKKALIKNQRTWLKFRTEYCELAYADNDNIGSRGTFSRVAISSCFADLAKERVKQFESMSCEEGDLSSTCLLINDK